MKNFRNKYLSGIFNPSIMRSIFTLTLLFIAAFYLPAQIVLEEYPLEANPVLKKIEADQVRTQEEKLYELFGSESAATKNGSEDCIDDGIYESGETVYILSGDMLEICLDTTGFISFDDLSVEGNAGMISTSGNCITYTSNSGVILGLGDTMRVELCLPDGGCTIREFPVVVKRENATFVESATAIETESDAVLCINPANYILPEGIASSSIIHGHDTNLASVINGNSTDSCAFISSNRVAGSDTARLEISNDYCICDTYEFPFSVIGDTLSLPFLDDFSYDGPFPGPLWVDKDAYVNNTWAYQPASVGFATMDGLDETGTPWGGGYGRADFLTSNYIDLSPYNSGSNVFLTCHVQPKGYGFYPNEADSLIIEFKKPNNEWVQIHAFQGIDGFIPTDSLPAFNQSFQFNIGSLYLYNGFQFRFVNYAQNLGIRDVWHVDYVKVTANQIPNGDFDDIAFTNVPNDIIKEYSSVPWRHFESSMFIDSIDIELFSQFDTTKTANPSGIKLTELETGAILKNDTILLRTNPLIVGGNQRNVPSQIHKFYRNPIDDIDFSGLNEDKLVFELEYNFTVTAQNSGLFPEVARNDTVKSRTVFDNYFAYDDGSAELSMTIGEALGEAVAVSYTALEPDTLRAIQVHFPHYSSMDAASFNLRIHVGSLGNVVFEQFDLEPLFTDAVLDTLQGFTTYRLSDDFDEPVAVAIPAGDFYVELEQANVTQLTRIGLDRNTPEAKVYQYFFLNGEWVGLGNPGAMMLRPVVGNFLPPNTPVRELVKDVPDFKVYPNPSEGTFYFDLGDQVLEDLQVSVFSIAGQLLRSELLQNGQIDLSGLGNGVYYIKIKNIANQQFETHKVTIFK